MIAKLKNPMMVLAALVVLGSAGRGFGYVDLAPTLASVVRLSQSISVVEVADYDREKHVITLKQTRVIKGVAAADVITHQLASPAAPSVPMAISQWAVRGSTGVLFESQKTALVCMGGSWYEVTSYSGGWKIGKERPDLPLAYCGTISRLADAAQNLAAGKDAIITVEAYGADDANASFDLAFNRTSLPGLARIDRVHMTPAMISSVSGASGTTGYVVGVGLADAEDLPALMERLASTDATTRAETAEEIGSLKKKARSAVAALMGLLQDNELRVRISAATALLRIEPATPAAVDVLSAALDSKDLEVKRAAAKTIGLAGAGAGPLTEKLVALLKDPDVATRSAALVSIATLGPAAAKASNAVKALLDDPATACDAADALGRIGLAAQPIPASMVKMLSSTQVATQWAAVRAMSQIGGPESHPAVEFMIARLQAGAIESQGYDMHIYLSMLGENAADALPTLQSTRIKNPILPSATQWAIQCDQYLPWNGNGGGRGMGGGPGGVDISKVIYDAYVNNFGERLRPATKLLANSLMDGTAGNVPEWGWRLLTCAPEDALKILTPHLADDTQQMRERAVVGLGYMGSAALPAKPQLTATLAKATDAREKNLIGWALRQLDREEE